MRNTLLAVLFPSRGRRELLRLLFREQVSGNASELARRARVTPRAALLVLRELERAGLAQCEGVGSSLVFRKTRGDVARALAKLLQAAEQDQPRAGDPTLEASAAYFGAPLLRERPAEVHSLESTLALCAKRSRRDPTLFRTLPLLVLRNWRSLDWSKLLDCSRKEHSKPEVGLLLDLAGHLAGLPELSVKSKLFEDDRRQSLEYFFEARSEFDEKLADRRTPELVRKWRFLMNMDLETLRSTVTTHLETPASV